MYISNIYMHISIDIYMYMIYHIYNK